jgi:hypothetical protein
VEAAPLTTGITWTSSQTSIATINAAGLATATSTTGPDGSPATTVAVTYQSANLIPIPGLMMGRLNVTRSVQMRVSP